MRVDKSGRASILLDNKRKIHGRPSTANKNRKEWSQWSKLSERGTFPQECSIKSGDISSKTYTSAVCRGAVGALVIIMGEIRLEEITSENQANVSFLVVRKRLCVKYNTRASIHWDQYEGKCEKLDFDTFDHTGWVQGSYITQTSKLTMGDICDICGILMCINARNNLKTLQLTHCINIIGHGLAPLHGSAVSWKK